MRADAARMRSFALVWRADAAEALHRTRSAMNAAILVRWWRWSARASP
ncbi:MAG: hypothetical protein RMK99_09205 [Anaerolineales bacterium]|nr:hypothetical protein [Anaerolineales bacterium]